ncbi:hypothetical protein ACQRET_03500 [Streptomyces koyangensis]|uniref:hypothetical protein n=1 Tax=Streptomyces koyangensis TaxID=188770 RepID=UPI003D0763CE
MPKPHTPPRQIRIGDDWYAFDRAAKAQSTERAELVRAFISWYLRTPGAKLPARPERAAWEGEEGTP